MIAFLGGVGARPERAGAAQTGQKAEFEAAHDPTQPALPSERWSRALATL